jgi:hypothetical protein
MKYCLDSCVAFKWAVAEADSAKADRIRVHFQNALQELIAPDSASTTASTSRWPSATAAS